MLDLFLTVLLEKYSQRTEINSSPLRKSLLEKKKKKKKMGRKILSSKEAPFGEVGEGQYFSGGIF